MKAAPAMANLLAFEAVARRRSFTAAANELHLTASAVSHQVAKLEGYLGVRLFQRSAHGVDLTASGEAYLARVAGPVSAIVSATEDLREGGANRLSVHSSPSIATLWLTPRLRGFSEAHPEISLNLSASHAPADFGLGQADLDIRYGVPAWPGLEVEPLFDERILPLASPSLIRAHGFASEADLLRAPLIQSAVSVVQWADWFAAYADAAGPGRFAMSFDRAQLALDAASQGLGVALESSTIANRHLAEGKLRPVFGPDKALTVRAHFCVYPARHARRRAVEVFLAWLREEASGSGRTTAAHEGAAAA